MPAATRTTAIGGRRSSPRRTVLAALGVCVALATPAAAAGPKPIGTMTLVDQPGLAGIAIVAYQWAAKQTLVGGGGGGAGGGKPAFDPFRVTKLVDATSPALLRLTFGGTPIAEVRIDVPLRRGTTASYVLTDVIITENDRHSAESGGHSLQTLALQPRAVRETIVSPGGAVATCWSLATNDFCD